MQHVERVLARVMEATVHIKLAKCQFAQKTVKYLGHVVSKGRQKPAEAKIRAISELAVLKTKRKYVDV